MIQELHAHHEARRESLRERHSTVYDEFEKVRSDLDTLAAELHHISEHGIALDANFSRFGYSAHLRTKDDDSSSTSDQSSSTAGRRDTAPVLKFWRRPVVRQYFHRGLVWRSARSGEVPSFELFSDLLFVGIIEVVGDTASRNPTGTGFVQFLITFIMTWKMWLDLTTMVNWFEIDDIFQRVCVMFYLVCVLGFATNLVYAFDATYTSMTAFYLTERAFQGSYYLWVAYLLPTVRGTMLIHTLLTLLGSAMWIVSIHVAWPNQLALMFLGCFFDLFGYMVFITIIRWVQGMSMDRRSKRLRRFGEFLENAFEFVPAVNIEHRTERANAFTTLVFGSSVLAILFQNRDLSAASSAFFGKACLALIQAFAFNSMYFEFDAANTHLHAIRRHWAASIAWFSSHIPFVMGYILSATTMSKLVVAHDCINAHPDTLGEEYQEESLSEIPSSLRWFYCGGLATALVFMSLISMSHIHKTIPNARLRKRPRLLIRCLVALIICFLPLASHRSLSSLSLMSITCALVVLALGVEIYGNSCPGDRFWFGGFCDEEKKKCQYRAMCPIDRRKRKELDKKIRRGDKVLIEDLLTHQPQRSISDGTLDTSTRANSENSIKKQTRPKMMHMHSYV